MVTVAVMDNKKAVRVARPGRALKATSYGGMTRVRFEGFDQRV